jgi:hypothetical protein
MTRHRPAGFLGVGHGISLYEACVNPLLFSDAAELYKFALDVRRRCCSEKGRSHAVSKA